MNYLPLLLPILLFILFVCHAYIAHAEQGTIECGVVEIVTQAEGGETQGLENVYYVVMPDGGIAF